MRTLIFTWYVLSCFFLGYSGLAQSSNIPDVIPPSPAAQQFHKFGEYPVALYSGIPEISVPIYRINTGDLSIPINILYHASGFRPTDRDGILGLNWTLNIGGQISRQIHGIADDNDEGLLLSNPRHTTNSLHYAERHQAFDYLRNVTRHITDSEFDIFSYSAGGSNGNFILKSEQADLDGYLAKPIFINNRKFERLSCYLHPTTKKIEAFDFLNENGERYRFGKSVSDNTLAYERTGTHSESYASNNITSWLLTEIISPDYSDTVGFPNLRPLKLELPTH